MGNIYSLQLLRNGAVYESKDAAKAALQSASGLTSVVNKDGVAVLARYLYDGTEGKQVRTLVGYYAVSSAMTETTGYNDYMTIIDVEGAANSVEELRTEINNKLGTGITSENTATAQLAALSGNNESTSAETSVEGAKKYADEKISQAVTNLDYTGVTTGDGVYVTNVTETDGVVAATTATLPSVTDTASAKTFVTSVSEDKGEISSTKGTITSSGKTIVLTDNADGGVNFEANVDGTTIIIDENTGVMSVASSALVQYEGDDDTIQISAVEQGVRTVSSPLTIQKVTTGLSEEVKEEYHLIGHSGTTIGDPVKIYKDSHIVSINYIKDSGDTHYQNLEYVYMDASGNTQTTYVDMSELVLEAEFASGVTITDHVAHGVVDSTSETFLTVGADGFKLSGVQNAIDTAVGTAVSGLDATVSAETAHVSVQIDEVDGKLTAVTLSESDIASADGLAELSGKAITEIESTNSSISAVTAATTDGTVKVDLTTDASKIKMTGFTAAQSGFTAITTASTVTEAVKAIETEMIDNEQTTSAALIDLNNRIDELSGGTTADLEKEIAERRRIEGQSASAYTANSGKAYISGATSLNDADVKLNDALVALDADVIKTVKVNNTTLAETENAVNIQVVAGSTAANDANAIHVDTANDGTITLTLGSLDCGTYD